MLRVVLLCAVAALAAACGFNPSGGAGDDVGDPDGGGDDDGGDGGSCNSRCEGDQLITCSAGVEDDPVTCPAGCFTSGGAHCGVMQPSNGATPADLDGDI